MKKLFCLMMTMLLALPLTGFVNASGGAVVYASGAVQEVVNVKYSTEDAYLLGTTMQELNLAFTQIEADVEQNLAQVIEGEINALQGIDNQAYVDGVGVKVTLDAGAATSRLVVVVTYDQKAIWAALQTQVVANFESTTTETFLTKTVKTVSPIRMSRFEQSGQTKTLIDVVADDVKTRLGAQYLNAFAAFESKYSYTYATTSVRLHTDADLVEKSGSMNYYTWDFDGAEDEFMTIWETRAKPVVWYLIALGLTAVFGAVLGVVALAKGKKAKQ